MNYKKINRKFVLLCMITFLVGMIVSQESKAYGFGIILISTIVLSIASIVNMKVNKPKQNNESK